MKTRTANWDYNKPGALYESVMLYTCRACGRPWDVKGGQCLACEKIEHQEWDALMDAAGYVGVNEAEADELNKIINWLCADSPASFGDPASEAETEETFRQWREYELDCR